MEDPPSLSSPNASPVLIPLVDAFNHERAKPVSWSIDQPNSKPTCLSLIFHTPSPSGSELYNNYGAKPNDELLLGYGFTIPDNPDDTLLLKLPGSEQRFKIAKGASGESMAVWYEIGRRLQQDFATDGDDLDVMMTELELEIGQILPEMIRNLRSKLPAIVDRDPREPLPGVRTDVYAMIRQYVKGQWEILEDLLEFANKRLEAALRRAEELGIDVSLEPEDDSGDE
ncbi:SubName: Full=Uncharacterized protein {ECO:0000313/EMBL:CCA72828.1} [Serendipita indica DSM 11827]|nr:SubName: Full=Uncharacterized protein {ECO:0000313/EMBL:CCA72828.1} [Serendipita indica DSM 11827]